jgi:hypothetical protein
MQTRKAKQQGEKKTRGVRKKKKKKKKKKDNNNNNNKQQIEFFKTIFLSYLRLKYEGIDSKWRNGDSKTQSQS